MLIDITYKVTKEDAENAMAKEKQALLGHVGTHFDVMGKEFPLEYTKRDAIVFDVSHAADREICEDDIDTSLIKKDMFVAFKTGYIEKEGYGTADYFKKHPQLSISLIEKLIEKQVSIIAVDFTGLRRGSEHLPWDIKCADKGIFVIENICLLENVLEGKAFEYFTAHTYPVNYAEMTGLPSRVIAEK